MLVSIPEPYDFELSTARFREYGTDRATVWHEGGIHRVVAGVETRVEPAPRPLPLPPPPPLCCPSLSGGRL